MVKSDHPSATKWYSFQGNLSSICRDVKAGLRQKKKMKVRGKKRL
jgi:hypothetical protein